MTVQVQRSRPVTSGTGAVPSSFVIDTEPGVVTSGGRGRGGQRANETVDRIGHADLGAVGQGDGDGLTLCVFVTHAEIVVERRRRGGRARGGATAPDEDTAAGAGERSGHGEELHDRDAKERFQLLPCLSEPQSDNGKTGREP